LIFIDKINEVFVRIDAERSIYAELDDHFKFHPANYKYDPKYRNPVIKWDGYVHLFKRLNRTLYIGLLPELIQILKKNNYEYTIRGSFDSEEFSEIEALEFIKTLNLPEKYEVRDYQLKYFIKGVRNHRMIGVSPTSSGKSLLLYLFYRYFNKRTLIIVPTIQLVSQMFNDFKDYGYEGDAHLIMEGETKITDKQLVISTYQAIYKESRSWLGKFGVILGDESHTFAAKSLIDLMEKTTKTPIKIGVTGTISKVELSNMTMKGLFGPISKFITTKELIDRGYSSPVFFKVLKLKLLNSIYRHNSVKIEYRDEIEYIINLPERIRFVANLALSLKGNTFVMFINRAHGKKLYEEIKKRSTVPVFYIDGRNENEEREEVVRNVETLEESITICSRVFSTGVNVKRIHNLIFTHPSKARIRTLQSIGRGLRKGEGKSHLMIFDIADDLIDDLENTTLFHMKERLSMYDEEQFPYKLYDIRIK